MKLLLEVFAWGAIAGAGGILLGVGIGVAICWLLERTVWKGLP
jgi:ABC-type lipoprotein release transport system permease subunit